MDHAVETRAERVRDHFRRPIPGRRRLLMKTARNTDLLNLGGSSWPAAMIFKVVVGVARETPVALLGGLSNGLRPDHNRPVGVARERSATPKVGLPSDRIP